MIDCHIHIERGPYELEWIKKFIAQGEKMGLSEIYILEHTHRFREFLSLYSCMSQYNTYQYNWLKQKGQHSINDYIHLIEKAKKGDFPIRIKFGLEVCYDENKEQDIEKNKTIIRLGLFYRRCSLG